jgi:hypothetical protein
MKDIDVGTELLNIDSEVEGKWKSIEFHEPFLGGFFWRNNPIFIQIFIIIPAEL